MHLANVIGRASGTLKDPPMTGIKLLVVQPVDGAGNETGPSEIVTDAVGAGIGDTVLVATGSAARQPAAMRGVATDASAIMIVDDVAIQD